MPTVRLNFTAFVPTNSAFSKYPDVLDEVLQVSSGRAFPDTTRQAIFIRSHVIRDLHRLSEFAGKTAIVPSIAGNPITIDGTTPGIYAVTWVSVDLRVATTHLQDTPIIASNALIYPVSSVSLT